jgi:hypothetical protein
LGFDPNAILVAAILGITEPTLVGRLSRAGYPIHLGFTPFLVLSAVFRRNQRLGDGDRTAQLVANPETNLVSGVGNRSCDL